MRQQIDCAVLRLATHRQWLEEVLLAAEPALARIRVHHLEWEAGQDLETNPNDHVTLPVQALAQAAVSLRRFDLCLIPVSLDTLAWTRQALAMIPRGPFLPLVGIFQNLKSAAMQDLLELGLCDFVRLPLCADEFRARVLTCVSRVPRPGTLREPEPAYLPATGLAAQASPKPLVDLRTRACGNAVPACATHGSVQPFIRSRTLIHRAKRTTQRQSLSALQNVSVPMRRSAERDVSFRQAKASLVEQFERDYITHALVKHNGNIAMAARASEKHRRAFWALMRKYEIDAEQYRPDDAQE